MPFTYNRVSLCFLIVRRIWTLSRLLNRELALPFAYNWTYCDVLTQLLHNLLDYTIQHTTYLLSCGLLGDASRPVSPYCYRATNHLHCVLAFGCKPSDTNTTLSHTSSRIGFVVRTAPPVSLQTLKFPLMWSQACKHPFFPQHSLHCYLHQSY